MVPEELTSEFLELKQECITKEEWRGKETVEEEEEEEESSRRFTAKHLVEAFADLNKFLKMFENMGPSTEMFLLVESNVHGVVFCLEANLWWEKASKSSWIYFWRVTSPYEELQASPSVGIPEEGIIPGDDSSMHVIAPEDSGTRCGGGR